MATTDPDDAAGQRRVAHLRKLLANEAAKPGATPTPKPHQAAGRSATPHVASQPASRATTRQKTAKTATASAKPRKMTAGMDKGGSDLVRALAAMQPAQKTAVLAVFRAHSTNPAAVDILAEEIPAIWAAMIIGAKKPGLQGVADRTALFKIMGLPWVGGAAARGADGKTTIVIGERLALALARSQAGGGRGAVTLDAEDEPEGRSDAAFEGDAHQIRDLLPIDDGQSAALDASDRSDASLEGE